MLTSPRPSQAVGRFVLLKDKLYLVNDVDRNVTRRFPYARHDEQSWAARCHLPLQLFSGRLRRAALHAALSGQDGPR